jgi:putative ABC transport system permease protein
MRPEAPATYGVGLVDRLGLRRLVPAAGRIIFRNIERRPLRALLAATGIALATAIVMTGWFMLDAMNVMKQIQFESVQRYDAMVVFDLPRSAEAGWELVNLPGVRRMEPYRVVPVRLRRGPASKRTTLLGLEPGSELQRLVDRDGTVRQVPRGGLLISDVLAADLDVAAGDTLTVEVLEGKRAVQAVPVAAVSHDIIGSSATMRLDALRTLLGEGATLSGAYLALDAREAPAIYRRLKRTPAVSGVVVRESVMRGFEETIAQSFWISISMMVAFACIIAAGIVYNGARVALSERGRELASLRVLGFFRGEVTRLLLGEQALLTIAGLPAGLLLGYGLAWLIGSFPDSARDPLDHHRLQPGRGARRGPAVRPGRPAAHPPARPDCRAEDKGVARCDCSAGTSGMRRASSRSSGSRHGCSGPRPFRSMSPPPSSGR